MKASDLRIGNETNFGKVYCIEDDIFYVRDSEGDSYKSEWADIEPIPLTEEWLLKLGFKDVDCDDIFLGDYGYSLKEKGLGLQYSHDEGILRID